MYLIENRQYGCILSNVLLILLGFELGTIVISREPINVFIINVRQKAARTEEGPITRSASNHQRKQTCQRCM